MKKSIELYQQELHRRREYASECLEIIRKRVVARLNRIKADEYTLTKTSVQDAIQNAGVVISASIKIPYSKNEVVSWLYGILKKLKPQAALFCLRYGVKSPYSKYQNESLPVDHTKVKTQSFDSMPILVKPIKDKINLPIDFLGKKEKSLLEKRFLFGQKTSTIARSENVSKRAIQIRIQNIIAQLTPKKVLFERTVNNYGYDKEGNVILLNESKFYQIESYGLDKSDFKEAVSIRTIPRDLRYNLQYEPSSEAFKVDVLSYRQKRFHEINQFKIQSIKSDYELEPETIKIDTDTDYNPDMHYINRQFNHCLSVKIAMSNTRLYPDTSGTLGGMRLSSQVYESSQFDYIPMTRPINELRFKTRKHKGITEYLPYYDFQSDHIDSDEKVVIGNEHLNYSPSKKMDLPKTMELRIKGYMR